MDLSALFGSISTSLSGSFGGPYFAGNILTNTPPVEDDGGSIITPGSIVRSPCMVEVDQATEAMRQADGYADEDRRMLVLSAGLAVQITTDHQVEITAGPYVGTWLIASVARDPFAAYWELRGRRAA